MTAFPTDFSNFSAAAGTIKLLGDDGSANGLLSVAQVATYLASLTQTLTNKTLTSPVLTNPDLGTPSAIVLTNATGLPIAGISATGTPSASTYLRGDGTWASSGAGTVTSVAQSFTGGLISVAGSPITSTGTLALTVAGTSGGIPYFSGASTWASSAALAANDLVIGGGAGAAPSTTTTGTGVLTALAVNVGSAGAFVTFNGALGTPSSGTLANATGLPISTGVSGLGTGVATFLATPSSANLAAAVTDETGSGALVFGTAPTFTTSITTPLVTITQGTITADAPQINGTVTFNSGAVTFTGWKLNVTDTASASATKLIDLQQAGTTIFNVRRAFQSSAKVDRTVLGITRFSYVVRDASGGFTGFGTSEDNAIGVTISDNAVNLVSGGQFAWYSSASNVPAGSADLYISRAAAGIAQLRGTGSTSPAAWEFYTYGASPPSAPSASMARLYADTSGGKIRIMAIFPSGAAQQIAIEP